MPVILFDDIGFADFGCCGSAIRTPHIDALAACGLRHSGFHTTAVCSTTRAALLTGRNHHSVGMGCLANFDSGYSGDRGKIAREAGTWAEMWRAVGFRNCMLGKWHVTPLTPSDSSGPFDGWPLGRGFTAITASWSPRPTSTRPDWCATTPTSMRPAASPRAVT